MIVKYSLSENKRSNIIFYVTLTSLVLVNLSCWMLITSANKTGSFWSASVCVAWSADLADESAGTSVVSADFGFSGDAKGRDDEDSLLEADRNRDLFLKRLFFFTLSSTKMSMWVLESGYLSRTSRQKQTKKSSSSAWIRGNASNEYFSHKTRVIFIFGSTVSFFTKYFSVNTFFFLHNYLEGKKVFH